MYDVRFRKLTLQMVARVGVTKTSLFTGVSRVTIWRWRKHGIQPKKRRFATPVRDSIRALVHQHLLQSPCTSALRIKNDLRNFNNLQVSTKTIYATIRSLNFSRKRTRWRGSSCPIRSADARNSFLQAYNAAVQTQKLIVSLDECGFSQRTRALYGYSPVGESLVVHRRGGGWINHSLLMAVFSDGRRYLKVRQGAVSRADVQDFLNTLEVDPQSTILVMDNASIHKRVACERPLSILYTPPYSPEFNAIELCFAKVKHSFRDRITSSLSDDDGQSVDSIIRTAIDALCNEDVINSFGHVQRMVATLI